ncbi:uncharacterized protein [Zea mays]|jgi:hypothetical protein|uniref:uncharacterized protein n=1 Tax=Zea mays TaxID=4577 RepID=UPI0004DEC839|nr:uncharacterized protein LOC103627845 [Zea mays]|eukprot:XP_008646384.1 uncharacterized protein LOC103627845 [Zea mays]
MWACLTLPVIPSRAPSFPPAQSSPSTAAAAPSGHLSLCSSASPANHISLSSSASPRRAARPRRERRLEQGQAGAAAAVGRERSARKRRLWRRCAGAGAGRALLRRRNIPGRPRPAPRSAMFSGSVSSTRRAEQVKQQQVREDYCGAALWEAGPQAQLPQATIQLTQTKNFFKLLYVRRPALTSQGRQSLLLPLSGDCLYGSDCLGAYQKHLYRNIVVNKS